MSWSTPPGPYPQLFALPRQPVSDADYAIGFYASALVRDGGTLQIGIGALADALCHALVLRHTDNAAYRRVLQALDPELERHPAVIASGGLDPFAAGPVRLQRDAQRRLQAPGRMPACCGARWSTKQALMQRLADGSASDRRPRAAGTRRPVPARRVLPRLAGFLRLAARPRRRHAPRHRHAPGQRDQRTVRRQRDAGTPAAPRCALLQQLHDGDRARRGGLRRSSRTAAWSPASAASTTSWRWRMRCRDARSVLMLRAMRDGRHGAQSNIVLELRPHAPSRATCATSTSTNTASPTCAA